MGKKQNKYADLAAPAMQIDLHGVKLGDGTALAQYLDGVITDAVRAGHKKLLFITGKGIHSEGGIARIKPFVEDYMRRHQDVLWVRDGKRDLGGSGAIEVQLCS